MKNNTSSNLQLYGKNTKKQKRCLKVIRIDYQKEVREALKKAL